MQPRSGQLGRSVLTETQAVPGSDDGTRSGSEQTTRVAFFTETHRVIADVDTGARRMVEVLRDGTRAYLDLRHLNISRIGDMSDSVTSSPRGVLQKSDIRLAAIVTEANRPERRLYGYVAKATVRVLALMSGCEIVGEMHLPEGTKDGLTGYVKLRDTFIHIGDATVNFTVGSVPASSVNTVILNRLSIQLLCLAE